MSGRIEEEPGMRGCGEVSLGELPGGGGSAWSGGQLAAKEGDRMWGGGAHCRED